MITENKLIEEGYKEVAAKFGPESSEYIATFKELLKKNIIKDTNEKNIDYWGKQGFEEFKKFIDKSKSIKTNNETKKEKFNTPHKDAKLFDETDNYEIFHITTYEAAKFMGRFYKNLSTKWCISTDESEYFEEHYGSSHFYFAIRKEFLKNNFDKIAIQITLPKDIDPEYAEEFDGRELVFWDISDQDHDDHRKGVPSEIAKIGKKILTKYKKKAGPQDDTLTIEECINGTFELVDGLYNVNGDVKFPPKYKSATKKIKFKFGKVTGDFDCSGTGLATLENCPVEVGGNFECGSNLIKNLKNAPAVVGGDFVATNCKLASLQGAPNKINGGFFIAGNNLITLEGSPQKITGMFAASANFDLVSLEGGPKEVGGDYVIYNTPKLESLKGVAEIGGEFSGNGKFTANDYLAYIKSKKTLKEAAIFFSRLI